MRRGDSIANQENTIIEVKIQSIQFKLNKKEKGKKNVFNSKINWEITYKFSTIEAQIIQCKNKRENQIKLSGKKKKVIKKILYKKKIIKKLYSINDSSNFYKKFDNIILFKVNY